MAENNNNRQGQGNQVQDQNKGDQKQGMGQQRQQGTQGGQGQPVDRDRDMGTGDKMGEQNQDRQKQGSRQGELDQDREIGKDVGGVQDLESDDLGDEEVEQDEDSRITQRNPSQGQQQGQDRGRK